MQIARTSDADKPNGVFTDSGNLIRDFYDRGEALSFMDHLAKFPAVVARVKAKHG